MPVPKPCDETVAERDVVGVILYVCRCGGEFFANRVSLNAFDLKEVPGALFKFI